MWHILPDSLTPKEPCRLNKSRPDLSFIYIPPPPPYFLTATPSAPTQSCVPPHQLCTHHGRRIPSSLHPARLFLRSMAMGKGSGVESERKLSKPQRVSLGIRNKKKKRKDERIPSVSGQRYLSQCARLYEARYAPESLATFCCC